MTMAASLSSDVAPRAPRVRGGHVESYFLRANHPSRPLAFWAKATVLKPVGGMALQESWFVFFDGERDRVRAGKRSEPLAAGFTSQGAEALNLSLCGAAWSIAPSGHSRGEVDGAAWDLKFTRVEGSLGEPLSIFPSRMMLEAPFPKSKLLTPFPMLRFAGEVRAFDEAFDVEGWHGMLGHNWGKEHALEYAWGQCLFPAEAGTPAAWVEGFTGRVKVGPVATPRLSALVVQRGDETWRFDRTFDPWTQKAEVEERRWTVELKNDRARAILEMDAMGRPLACLGYKDPTGAMGYCINTKLARTKVTVEPAGAAAFTLESAHGGALEFMRREPVRGLQVI